MGGFTPGWNQGLDSCLKRKVWNGKKNRWLGLALFLNIKILIEVFMKVFFSEGGQIMDGKKEGFWIEIGFS